jgi:hypothetical protein
MQLDRISARIAPRTPWQAMDMGTHLYRAWWKPLTLIWLSFSLPLLLLTAWLLFNGADAWAMFLLWWLKPVLERPLLEYCARRLFSQPVTLWTLLREFHRYALPGLLPWLLWRRVDMSRAFSVPVAQLERQRGNGFRERCRVLASGAPNRAVILTVLMAHIEFVLSYAVTVLVMMMMPGQYYLSEVDWFLQSSHYALLGLLTWYLTLTVLEPLYVSCGFALYLNKRTWLEGWDLELGMRRIGERRRSVAGIGTLLLLCTLTLTAALPADAETDTAKQQSIEILASEQFMPMPIEESWQWRDRDTQMQSQDKAEVEWLVKLLKWLFDEEGQRDYNNLPSLSDIFRVLLWAVAISLLLWVLWHYRRWLASLPARRRRQPTRLTHISGLDIRPESLPEDIPASMLSTLDQGNVREALSLLYRATLSRLAAQMHVVLLPGATEQEVLLRFHQQHPDHTGVALLDRITPLWISTAWAHRPPQQDELRDLIGRWSAHFSGAAATTELSA